MKKLTLALLVLASGVAAADTLYVNNVIGNDTSYDGRAATVNGAQGPKKTIQAAIDAASAGDTVLVAPGVYGEEQGSTPSATAGQTCRVFISKSLTVKSSVKGGAVIVGSLAYGPAAEPVTAFRVSAHAATSTANPVEINGFVIRDCTNSTTSIGGVIGWNGQATPYLTEEIGPFVVDCVISNCTISCAGVLGCVNAIRTHVRNCSSNQTGLYLKNANAAFSVFAGANNKGVNCGTANVMVNCTFVGGEHVFSSANRSKVYNSLATGGANANTYLSLTRNSIFLGKPNAGNSPDYDETVVWGSTYSSQQIASPILGDYRPLEKVDGLCPNAAACDFGSTNYLALVPERYRNADFEGNAFTARDGKIHVGAVQTSCAPSCGFYTTDTKLRVNGAELLYVATYSAANQTFLGTNDWPRVYELSATNEHLFAYWTDGIANWRFPNRANKALYVPQNGRLNQITAQAAAKVLYVDCDAAANGDGTEATPYDTIQKAVDAVTSGSGDYANIYVAPGTYDKGETEWSSGVSPKLRVKISGSRKVRVIATSSTEPTVIKGAADTTAAADANGNGPNAVRVIRANSICCFSGFTITDGHTDTSSAKLNSWKKGGAFMCESNKNCWLMDCIVCGNYGADGGAVLYGGSAARCVFTNNVSNGGWFFTYGDGDIRCELVGCVVSVDSKAVIPACTKLVNCTIYSPNPLGYVLTTSGHLDYVFNTLIVNNSGNSFGTASSAYSAGNVMENCSHSSADKRNAGVDAYRAGTAFLVDPANGDWHVATASTAIGNGCAWNGLGDETKWPAAVAYSNYYALVQHDFDGNGFNFVDGKPTAGACQFPTRHALVVSANRASHVTLAPTGTNYVGFGSSVTVTATPKDGRTVSGLAVNGEPVAGATCTFPAPDALSRAILDVRAFVNTNWYVDAVGGSDALAHGWAEDDAFATLSNAMSRAESGDVVVALPGTYREGTMIQSEGFITGETTDSTTLRSRVVVPDGVSLVSRDGAEATVIEGVRPAGNFGAGALRCVYLRPGATLRGFTVTGGSTLTYDGSRSGDDYTAGGIFCAETANPTVEPTIWTRDCIISNNYARTTAGGTYYGGFARCRFFDNRCRDGAGGSCYAARLLECIFDGNWGVQGCNRPNRAYGCTFGAHNMTWAGNSAAALEADATSSVSLYQFKNCLFLGGIRCKIRCAYDCLTPSADFLYSGFSTYLFTNIAVAAVSVDANYAPDRDSAAQNLANPEWVQPGELEGDVYGNPRRANGGMDVGAVETDWRERYAHDLSSRRLTVTEASWNVVEDANRRVTLNDGTSLACTLDLPVDARPAFTFSVGAGATLTVERTGASTRTFTAGNWTLPLETYAANEQFRFSVADGTATLETFKVNKGLFLLVR